MTELSKTEKIIALPEEDTIFINNDNIEVIGNKPYYKFENGTMTKVEVINKNN